MWEKFPSGGPPPPTPPVWEFSHFFTVFVKLVMPFYKLLNWKKQWKIWSGFGSDPPPPVWEFFPHNPVFFWQRPLVYGRQLKRLNLEVCNKSLLMSSRPVPISSGRSYNSNLINTGKISFQRKHHISPIKSSLGKNCDQIRGCVVTRLDREDLLGELRVAHWVRMGGGLVGVSSPNERKAH